MRSIRAWLARLGGFLAGSARDGELDAELQAHLDLHIDDNIRAGMTPEAARRAAVIALGGIEATKERYRDRRGIPLLDTLRQDLLYAVRTFRRHSGFTATAILTLALGIGVNTAIFSVVNAVLLRPLPFTDSSRLALIFSTNAKRSDWFDISSYPAFADWRDRSRSFESMAAFASRPFTVEIGGSTVMVPGKRVTPNLFHVVGVGPAIGRAFRPDEEEPGASAVAILSDRFWRRYFAGNASVLGQTLRINERAFVVIGVMPPAFDIEQTDREELYLPLPADPDRGHEFLHVIGRLRPATGLDAARRELEQIAVWQAQTYPRYHAGAGVRVLSMTDGLARDARGGLYTLLAVVTLVLLIACANVAGLMLARGSSRQHELAVRAALGAGRSRLVRQLLTESLLLAAAGGVLGLLAGDGIARALSTTIAARFHVPRLDAVHTDGAVLAFSALVSVATGVLFGALPALLSASPELDHALREGGRSSTERRAPRLRSALVVLETALALVLLAGAGTLLKTFLALRATPPGFDVTNVLAIDLFLPQPRFAQRPARAGFFDAALSRINAVPGVQSAAFVADLPLGGSNDTEGFHLPGRPDPAPGKWFRSGFNIATAGYFALMRIPVISGREFTERDGATSAPVVVINETAARTFWPGESAIGRTIDLPLDKGRSVLLTVVGVTADVRHAGLGVQPRSEMFVNSLQSELPWPSLVLVVRTAGNPAAVTESVKAAVRAANPNVPVQRATTLDAVLSMSIFEPRLYTFLLGAFAALAMALAAVGLYGLVSYSVAQRSHEIGVRVALGAGTTEIVRMVVGQGMRLACAGAAAGLVAALATTRLLVGLVTGIEPNDPLTFVAVTAVLLGSTLLATYLPARRAARIDPVTALRSE